MGSGKVGAKSEGDLSQAEKFAAAREQGTDQYEEACKVVLRKLAQATKP